MACIYIHSTLVLIVNTIPCSENSIRLLDIEEENGRILPGCVAQSLSVFHPDCAAFYRKYIMYLEEEFLRCGVCC